MVADDSAHGGAEKLRAGKFADGDEEKALEIQAEALTVGRGLNGTGKVPLSVGFAKGSWLQVGYNLCTCVSGAPLLGLPFAMALLGWAAGTLALMLGFFVTLWTSRIVASFHEHKGHRHIRYRDLAAIAMGPNWGKFYVWPCQWGNLIGALISFFIQAGLSFKAVYTLLGGETLTLTEMIVIMAVVCMIMAQIPTMHALWFINFLNLVSVFIFTYMTVAVAIWQTCYYNLPRDYGVHGSPTDKAFGVFQGIVIMHFAYGNTLIPELQATAKPPSIVTMKKAIWMLYAQLTLTYLPSAFIGYAAYGQAVVSGGGSFLPFFMAAVPTEDNPSPKWALVFINLLVLWNSICFCLLYIAPVTEHFETKYMNDNSGIWAVKNWLIRTVIRCAYIFFAALIAAMFPYFGDILALVGALGITPLDFLLPLAMYIFLRKPVLWKKILAWILLIFYVIVMILGAVAAIRGIVLDASHYSVFPNLAP